MVVDSIAAGLQTESACCGARIPVVCSSLSTHVVTWEVTLDNMYWANDVPTMLAAAMLLEASSRGLAGAEMDRG